MALEARYSERLQYGHHPEGAAGKEIMMDKHQAAQVDMESR